MTAAVTAAAQPEAHLPGGFFNFLWNKTVLVPTTRDALANAIPQNLDPNNPLLICVDVETYCVEAVKKEFAEAQEFERQARANFEAVKSKDQNSDLWINMRQALLDAEAWSEQCSKNVREGGLNVGTGNVRLIQVYWGGDTVLVADLHVLSREALEPLYEFLNSPGVAWVGHYLSFDMKMLSQYGFAPAKTPHCTMLQNVAITSLSGMTRTLAYLCDQHLGKKLSKQLQVSDWGAPTLTVEQISYASTDVVATYELFWAQDRFISEIKRLPQENCRRVYNLLRGAMPAVNEVVTHGIGFDAELHWKMCEEMEREYDALHDRTLEAFKAHSPPGAPKVQNPGSYAQVSAWVQWVLLNTGARTVGDWPVTDTGAMSTGQDTLEQYKHMIVQELQYPLECLIEWAEVKKEFETLGWNLRRHINPFTQNIHANFRIGGTETFRFSVTEPALQTIKRPDEDDELKRNFRKLFKARKGRKFVVLDLGQIELRVPACLSKDRFLLEAVQRGLDIHVMTACACFQSHPLVRTTFGQIDLTDLLNFAARLDVVAFFKKGAGKWMRQAAKNALFGLLFGQQPKGLTLLLRKSKIVITVDEATAIQHAILDLFVDFKAWKNLQEAQAEVSGFLWTPCGNVYKPRGGTFTKAINTPSQGGAAEIMLLALSRFPKVWQVEPDYRLDAHLVHTVHDELIADVAEHDAAEAFEVMKETLIWAATTIFPQMPTNGLVSGGIGDNWADAKD